jgi:flavin-dependent dehydrogenase
MVGREVIQIAGAGPAGLAAAIALARAGREVTVHEARREVGFRFGRDLQGLENWSTEQDVIAELEALGLSTAFDKMACTRGTVYDPHGRAQIVHSKAPIFYMVERGPGPGTLDSVERTVKAFRRLAGLEMRDPKPHGGVGNFRVPASAQAGERPIAGEEAGFQDALWGFGMRFAIRSGVLAARAFIQGGGYDALWRRELRPWLRTSIVNRALYSMLGNRGYAWFVRRAASTDAREFLRRRYRPTWLKRALDPWARLRYRSRRRDASCDHLGCQCIWCRCGGTLIAE